MNPKTHKLWIIFLLAIVSGELSAQYFGRNKVQYESFDFKTLQTEHFDIYFYPKEKEVTFDAAIMLERWQDRFQKIFGKDIGKNQPIILYANHADFQQTNVIGEIIPQGTGGVTEGLRNRIVLPFTGIYRENDHVLGHELVHAFQYNVIKASRAGLRGTGQIPLWFIEGLAEYLSLGRHDAHTAMWMRDAVLNKDIPSLDDISSNYKYFPYRYGQAVWSYITGKYGDKIIAPLFKTVVDSGWQQGFRYALGVTLDSLSKGWEAQIRNVYQPDIEGRTHPKDIGRLIISGEGGMNMSPVVSPDGNYLIYFSRREIFTLDLYLADANTGKVIKKLITSNSDVHFDALRFINSSGSWSPDGKKFAFVAIESGDDRIIIVDTESRDVERKIDIADVDAFENIAWSPDGNSLLLSGSSGGISDLFLYNLNTKEVQQLTNDKFADIMPAWSPDGKSIAFVTDRGGSTDFNKLEYSSINIGLMDINSKRISILKMIDGIKHINPQYSPDGKDLFFIADPDGYSDIYRYSFGTKNYFRITKCATGISGLTELSPALSVAKNTGRLVFSVFDDTEYNINYLGIDQLEGERVFPDAKQYAANTILLSSISDDKSIVEDYLEQPELGLTDNLYVQTTDYKPSLQLLYIGQPYIGVAVDRFGTGLGGGASFLFSDLLGNHILSAVVQAGGTFKDIGGQVVYLNMSRRFNWGGAVGHIPYLTGYSVSGYDTVESGGEKFLVQEFGLVYQRVFYDELNAIAQYPISESRRWELSAGYTRVSYNFETERILATLGGQIISRETEGLDAPSALNLFQTSLAYVGDFSFFGFTSPVNGSRYRFEVEPTLGSLNFVSALADYRKYFFMNPVTFALRAFHYGRYFGDADNERLTPLTLGFDNWVRGYSLNSFDPSECSENSDPGECSEFNRLIGSRVGVFNAELRIPVFGTEQFGLINFPYLPLELNAFFDGGVAWDKDEDPIFKFVRNSTERIPVFSTGVSARINVLGYIIAELYYAYPFQRPMKGWHFGFLISPGW